MIEMPESFDSVFRYIVVVSQRAEQLINGARTRAESDHFKPTLSAKDDVDLGHVSWRILTQEELDAQRQAVVEEIGRTKRNDGTPIYAPAAGRVTFAEWFSTYGRTLEITHGLGIKTRYAHMSRIAVRLGQRVSRGDFVGRVGSTGRSTAPHLHYEVHVRGKLANPIHYILN